MGSKSITAVDRSSSLLDRVRPKDQNLSLSETQSEVDGLVGGAISTVSDEKMIASLFGAGLAGRFIRLGSVAASGQSLAPWAVQGISHATALAGESAVFASMERGFAHMEGNAPTQTFQKDWARAAINLASIKLLGGVARGQNLLTQHLLIDSSMVAGHHAAYAFGVTDKPEGSLAQQMIHAEGMNLGMKGSLALLHGISPRISAMERSIDLALESPKAELSQKQTISFFPKVAMAVAAGPEISSAGSGKAESPLNLSLVFAKGGSKGGSPGKLLSPLRRFGEWLDGLGKPTEAMGTASSPPGGPLLMAHLSPEMRSLRAVSVNEALGSPEPSIRIRAAYEALQLKEPSLRPALEKALLSDTEVEVRITAARALDRLGILGRGAKSLELANAFHNVTVALTEKAKALNRKDPLMRLRYLHDAFVGEWLSAHCLPPRNEKLRAIRYAKAVQLALEAERHDRVNALILDALKDDFGAVAQTAIMASAKKLKPWNNDRRFILKTLEEAKAHLKVLETLGPELATAGSGSLTPKPPIIEPTILKMSSMESKGSGGAGELRSGSSAEAIALFQAKLRSIAETPAETVSEYERLQKYEQSLEGKKSIYLLAAITKMAQEKVRTGEVSTVTPEAFVQELYRKIPEAGKDLPLEDFFHWFSLKPSAPLPDSKWRGAGEVSAAASSEKSAARLASEGGASSKFSPQKGKISTAQEGISEPRTDLFTLFFLFDLKPFGPFLPGEKVGGLQASNFRTFLRVISAHAESQEASHEMGTLEKLAQDGNKKAYLILHIIDLSQQKVRAGEVSTTTPESFLDEIYQKMPDSKEYMNQKGFFDLLRTMVIPL